MIYKIDSGTFVISSDGVWLPGVYADETTAREALKLPDDVLQKLQDAANARGDGTITAADLAGARSEDRELK